PLPCLSPPTLAVRLFTARLTRPRRCPSTFLASLVPLSSSSGSRSFSSRLPLTLVSRQPRRLYGAAVVSSKTCRFPDTPPQGWGKPLRPFGPCTSYRAGGPPHAPRGGPEHR